VFQGAEKIVANKVQLEISHARLPKLNNKCVSMKNE